MSGHNPYCFSRKDGGKHYPDRNLLVFGSRYSMLKKGLIRPTIILVEEPDEYSFVLNEIKTESLPKGSIALFDRSSSPDAALAMVDKKIGTTKLYFSIPRDASSFENIHGENIALGKEDEFYENFSSLESDCKRLGGVAIKAESEASSAARFLEKELEAAHPDDLIVLISHVEPRLYEEGGENGSPLTINERLVMPFSDGTFLEIPKNNKNGPSIWILGCNTWDELSSMQLKSSPTISISNKITYHEAVFLARKIMSDTGNLRQRINTIQRSTFLKGAPLELKADLPEVAPMTSPPASEIPHPVPERPTQKVEFVVELINEGSTFVSDDKVG